MMMTYQRLTRWVLYYLNAIDPAWYILAALLLAALLLMTEEEGRAAMRWDRRAALIFSVVFFYLMLSSTVFSREVTYHGEMDLDPFNVFEKWRRGHSLRAEVTLNLLLLMPLGLSIPQIGGNWSKPWLTILLGFAASSVIESLQMLLGRGLFEISDIVFNTAGVALGYLLWRLLTASCRMLFAAKGREKKKGKGKSNRKGRI